MMRNSSLVGIILVMSLLASSMSCSGRSEVQETQSANLPEDFSLDDSKSPSAVPVEDTSQIRGYQRSLDDPPVQQVPKEPVGRQVFFNTSDGVRIAATLFKSDADSGVILVHMMGKDRRSWDPVITNLATKRAVIAIDLRGNGQSGGVLRKFTDDDYRAMVNDVAAARKELGKREIAIVGASIGANAAIKYAAIDPSVKTVIALSPGLDYHGLRIDDVMPYINRSMLVIASSGDQYSYSTMRRLYEMNRKVETKELSGDKHGTDMFGTGKGVESDIVGWTDALLG